MPRVGNGFDVHALVAGRRLVLGGVTVPFDRGLDGHSDADVVLHAICDAILGAIGAGDIGRYFPDTDAAYKDADSRVLLREVWRRAEDAGYALGNVDVTIIAQAPKVAPYVAQMVVHIAADLQATPSQVNVKATTTERLGFTGRGEGIAALATVLLLTR
ncbi:MAG: 2-C-methyl-D-erythritol 2,4-cyclodiphosphate synthase [Casimicrobiaceae bacterium]